MQHAIIRGQTADDETPATETRQQALQMKIFKRAVTGLCRIDALADDTNAMRQMQFVGEFGTVAAGHAMNWPRAAMFAKGGVAGGMPVATGADGQAVLLKQPNVAVENRYHRIAIGHGQRSTRQKIILDIDNQQNIARPGKWH